MESKVNREDYPLGQGQTVPVDIYVITAATYFELPY
jgi:hypothetical protein